MPKKPSVLPLLELPEPCLLAVLQACSNTPRDLFAAARAHSKLHQGSAVALTSITASLPSQQTADNVAGYLGKYGDHVTSITLQGQGPAAVTLQQLGPGLLRSLELSNMSLRVQPSGGFQGVLGCEGVEAGLEQLQLHNCALLDKEAGLADALLLLPRLQHLSIETLLNSQDQMDTCSFPWYAVQGLEQLTCLRLSDPVPYSEHHLRHLRGLTRLQELQLMLGCGFRIEADMLAGMRDLTHLSLSGSALAKPHNSERGTLVFDPTALADKSLLQHLTLASGKVVGPGATGVMQLLAHLQQLTALTHLGFVNLASTSCAPAAAYAALTASSKLQHLAISKCVLPQGVWQHLFAAARKLPQLEHLDISHMRHPEGAAALPDSTLLSSCCPALGWLGMHGLTYTSEALLQLHLGLTELRSLSLDTNQQQDLQGVCQLTGLQQLSVLDWCSTAGGQDSSLLALTQLRQLTALTHIQLGRGVPRRVTLRSEGPEDEPVWRQLLGHHLNHSDPEVAQQAAAALAE